jgi:hypothetical protein
MSYILDCGVESRAFHRYEEIAICGKGAGSYRAARERIQYQGDPKYVNTYGGSRSSVT